MTGMMRFTTAMFPLRITMMTFVLAVHACAAWALVLSCSPRVTRGSDSTTVIVRLIQPRLEPHDSHSLKSPRMVVVTSAPEPDLALEIPPMSFATDRNSLATLAAPMLDADTGVDMLPYAREAALRAGEGATVVLRIEVLADGLPGRIAVDVSSGSDRVDQAAADYARAHRWIPGETAGVATAMWVRWGIRLQA